MKGIVIKKVNLGEFVKSHKKEIITGAIVIAVIGGLVYISYKSGFKAGVKATTPIEGGDCQVYGSLKGDSYILGITGPMYGGGMLDHGAVLSHANAAEFGMGILRDLGYLKEIVEVPEKMAMEVVSNG